MIPVINKLRTNKFAKWVLLIIAGTTLVFQSAKIVDPAVLGIDDFIEYWSAARLQLAGQNPYSPEQIWAMEKAQGWSGDSPLMMWNPPWTLTFILPFGVPNYLPGRLAWLILNLGLVLFSASAIWEIYGGTRKSLWISWIVAFLFFPTLYVLRREQIGPLILIGLVGFLYFEKRQQYGWAGAATVLIAIKPHLLHLFWIALAIWTVERRRWSILYGATAAALLGTGIPLLLNFEVVGQYLYFISHHLPFYYKTTTLGALLRLIAGPEKTWLQFLPAFLSLFWFGWYWHRNRGLWNWVEQMPLLLLVCLMTTSYGWNFDQVVLLPAVIEATFWIWHHRQRLQVALIMGVYLLINGVAWWINLLNWSDLHYVWLAPVLLLGYLALRQRVSNFMITEIANTA